MASARNKPGTDVAQKEETVVAELMQSQTFADDALRSIRTFEDMVDLAQSVYGEAPIDAAETLGDGFTLIKDLSPYINKPTFIIEWSFRAGDFGDDYVSIRFGTQREPGAPLEKLVYNDGGTGICRQLKDLSQQTGRMGNLWVRNGFRVSEYDTIKSGEPWKQGVHRPEEKAGKGKTWYLNV